MELNIFGVFILKASTFVYTWMVSARLVMGNNSAQAIIEDIIGAEDTTLLKKKENKHGFIFKLEYSMFV